MNKKSPFVKIITALLLIGIGVFIGKNQFFGQKCRRAVPNPFQQ